MKLEKTLVDERKRDRVRNKLDWTQGVARLRHDITDD